MIRNTIIGVLLVAVIGLGLVFYITTGGKFASEHLISVEKVEKLGKLELVKFKIKDVLQETKERPLFLPTAKALLVISADVVAGIDMEKITKDDIVVTKDKVTITLPKPELLSVKINHQESKVYDVKWGGFSEVQIVEEAYKNAEKKITDDAVTMGYENMCKQNAKALLTPLFSEMSGKEVEIVFKN